MSYYDESKVKYDIETFCVLPGVVNARRGMQHAPKTESFYKRRLCVKDAQCDVKDCPFFHLQEGCMHIKGHICRHSNPYQPVNFQQHSQPSQQIQNNKVNIHPNMNMQQIPSMQHPPNQHINNTYLTSLSGQEAYNGISSPLLSSYTHHTPHIT